LEVAIPNLVGDLINGETIRLTDSASVSEIFHSHGVNMRYLGKVALKIDVKEHPHLKILLERVMLVKSLKHIFRELMKDGFSAELLCHLLNLVFSNNKTKKLLEEDRKQEELGNEDEIKKEEPPKKKEEEIVPKKKKKKGKKSGKDDAKKEEVGTEEALVELKRTHHVFLKSKPKDVWQRVGEIVNNRYGYQFEKNYEDFSGFKFSFNKLAILRLSDILFIYFLHSIIKFLYL
jgi:Translation initiation factor eIF3 subunit 135